MGRLGWAVTRKDLCSKSPFVASNWGASADSSGSTPGRVNSITPKDYDLGITSFSGFVSSVDSNVTFKVVVKNCGAHSTSPFEVDVFLDSDEDRIPGHAELATARSNIVGLAAGDSLQLVLHVTTRNLYVHDAYAVVRYISDEDSTNISAWANIDIAYTAKCLVVNEIMYDPKSPEPRWVEFFNVSEDSIDLRGFTLSSSANSKVMITTSDYVLPPKDYVVIAHDTALFAIHSGIRAKVLIEPIPSLKTTSDDVVIHDACGNSIDSVTYLSSWGGNSGGRSLERVFPDSGSNDPTNWQTSTDSSRSTPTRTNSVTPRDFDLAVGTIQYSPLRIRCGDSISLSASIINRGLKKSSAAQVVFFNDVNGNGNCDASETMDSMEVSPLVPGDSTIVHFVSRDAAAALTASALL